MAKLVTGSFNARSSAMLAIEDLMRHGFAAEDMSLLNTDTNLGREFFTDACTKAPEGGMIGVVIGMLIGGLVAALVPMGYIQDGMGLGLSGLSVMSAALLGMGFGGIVGLILGALIGSAIPEFEVKMQRADKKHGGILVGVYTHNRRTGEVRRLLEAAGGRNIRTKGVRDEKLPELQRDRELARQ